MNYSTKEIESNISVLTRRLEELKLKRTEITKDINHTKKQIQYWVDLDKSQLNLFK